MTTAQCPVCGAESVDSLLCHADTLRVEQALAEVPGLVADLDVTRSKQARIGGGTKGGLASERTPIGWGGVDPRWVLENVLTTWARDVAPDHWFPSPSNPIGMHIATNLAARVLLDRIPEIRRHPAVDELVDEILDAVSQARRAIDRPAERQYLGQCLVPTPDEQGRDVTCLAEIYARHGASSAVCKVCGITHDVIERRAWLLSQAADMIVTVREASSYLGEVGDIKVSQASIRGYIHRGKIAYRPGAIHGIRLGDLLTVVLDEGERRSA